VAEEVIRFRVTDEGTLKTAANFKQLSSGISAANDNYKALSSTASKTATTLAAFGGSLRAISPELGVFGSAVGRASGAITGMTEVLGGPWGVAIGLAVTALGIFSEHMRDAKDDVDELTRAVEENQAAIERAQQLRETADKYRQATIAAMEIIANASGLTDEAQRKNQEAIIKQFEDTGGIGDNIADRARKEPGANAFGITEYTRNQGQVAGMQGQLESYKRVQDLLEQQQKDLLDRKRKENEAFLEANKSAFDQTLQDAREYDAEKAKIDEAQKQRYDELRMAGISTFTAVSANGLEAIHQLVKGHKMSVREIVAGIGDTIWAQGQGHFLLGLANAFIPGMQGSSAGLIGIGLAEMAAGGALGAATRSGGGSGAGGHTGRSESPVSAGGGSNSSGPTTVIINMPTVVSPDANTARTIVQHVEEGLRHGTVRNTPDGLRAA
jgi:hypothetical protein